jgi:hypothetical protein
MIWWCAAISAIDRNSVGSLTTGRASFWYSAGNRLERELRRDFAFGVAAHAVGQQEDAGLARVAVAHAVLVLLPATLAAHLEDGELHGRHGDLFTLP